jgi:hypothetical protein
MANENLLEIDELSLYFGDPYVVNQYITITLPKIGDVVKFGERQYYSMIQTITAIPSEMKSQLWDMGLDWTQLTDFQLFMMLAPTLSPSQTSIIFGDLNLQNMRPFENSQNETVVLADPETGVIIDELAYGKMQSYLCSAHNLTKKVEKAANEFTKKFMIDEDRQKIEHQKKQPHKSLLKNLISAVKCRQGYTLDYVRNMGIVEFFDDVSRLQVIVHADALLQGSYSGMVDTKKIPKKEFDWCREITDKKNNSQIKT